MPKPKRKAKTKAKAPAPAPEAQAAPEEEAPQVVRKKLPERRYRCIKHDLYFMHRTWKEGEIYADPEPPKCGKGKDLTQGDNPAFVEI